MLQGAFLITQAAGRSMVQNRVHNGSIVHISSIVAKVNFSCIVLVVFAKFVANCLRMMAVSQQVSLVTFCKDVTEFESESKCCRIPTIFCKSRMRQIFRLIRIRPSFWKHVIIHQCH